MKPKKRLNKLEKIEEQDKFGKENWDKYIRYYL